MEGMERIEERYLRWVLEVERERDTRVYGEGGTAKRKAGGE